jgi:hypothetical protein
MTMTGYNPNPLNGADFDVLQFNVGVQTVNPISSIPSGLVTVTPIPEINSNITRTLTFSPVTMGPNQLNGEFLINGATMDLNVINYTIPLDNTEIWELTNQSGISHPFHIHDVQFYILTRNGVAPAINEQGRKDVVLVRPQETVSLQRFICSISACCLMQELFSITQNYVYFLFKQILKYIIFKSWENFSSFGFCRGGFVCRKKPKGLKYAAGFQLVGNSLYVEQTACL